MNELMYLQIETTNYCNGKCIFCPHEKILEKGSMSDDLYTKIIEEASQLPNLKTFHPMLNGEPFLDKNFMNRLKFAREKLPQVEIEVYTNGSLLTESIIYELKEIPNFHLSVSLNGLKPETRKKLMGLDDYWHVVQMFKLMENEGVKYRATMVAYPEVSQDEVRAFIESGGIAIRYQSWAGTQYPYDRRRWTSCPRAINQMTVLYTGEVCLCCFDPLGEVTFGNLSLNTIEEIWNSDLHREYRSMHKQGRGHELPKCKACTEG